ncbi:TRANSCRIPTION FACTOR LHW [Salix purpurea]|uniref:TRANSCRIPTION FACTOR LHW n=1 Tax=Salix purpurea TaxID=77065 RepID=A0A9Q0SW83_SALPP|nr:TRANSCRIPTION FACTOR LHW [Salix purpurea]
MQTIVVVPVCPHGVLQLGSSSADNFNQQIISSQAASRIVGRPSCFQPRQIQDNELASSSAINIHNVTKISAKYCDDFCEPKNIPVMKPDNPFMDQLANGVVGAEVIPSNPDSLAMSYVKTNGGHSLASPAGVGIQNAGSSGAEEVHLSSLLGRFSASGILSGSSNPEYHPANVKHTENEICAVEEKVLPSGDDLYDTLVVLPPMMAFEVGSRSMVSPIIVEDLNPPSQMLVEMLCAEQGFFLEIANSIRGLGLTILKGVMEAQNDNMWARFAVEANRDITRMEIFMSLVQHLEQAVKGSAAALGALENDDMKVHLTFPQTTSMPATGLPSLSPKHPLCPQLVCL